MPAQWVQANAHLSLGSFSTPRVSNKVRRVHAYLTTHHYNHINLYGWCNFMLFYQWRDACALLPLFTAANDLLENKTDQFLGGSMTSNGERFMVRIHRVHACHLFWTMISGFIYCLCKFYVRSRASLHLPTACMYDYYKQASMQLCKHAEEVASHYFPWQLSLKQTKHQLSTLL